MSFRNDQNAYVTESERKLLDANGNPAKPVAEILIIERPEILKTIIDGITNALAPYGGINQGEKLIFVSVVLGYAKIDKDNAIQQVGVCSPYQSYSSVPASVIFSTARNQALTTENNIAQQAKRD